MPDAPCERAAAAFIWARERPISAAILNLPPETPMPLMTRFAVLSAILALLALPVGAPANAQVRQVPTQQQFQLSYAPVVKRVAPAVVNVYAAKIVRNRNPMFDDPFFRHFFGLQGGGSQVQRSLGSGVIVDPRGLIVTNMHVIRGADEIKVALADKREFEASVVLKDPRSDLAVLRIKGSHDERFPFLEFANSDALEVGDVVIAIGNPFGVGQTVTHGIVSALARTDVGTSDYQFFIQTDAAINPGNSGGALVDLHGRLVGINSAIFSRSGGWQGIGFAIPSNMVKVVVESAEGGSHAVRRPWLGADLQSVTPEIADSMSLNRPVGALVANVTRDSPAAQAGLQPGDVITSIDGQPVEDVKAFNYRFATKPLGATAQLGVLRKGHVITASVPLRTAPSGPRDEVTIRSRSPLSGATFANLSPALADELGLHDTDKGVVVVGVQDGSFASGYLQRGDVILALNNRRMSNTAELARAANETSRIWNIVIQRGNQRITRFFSG